MLENPSFAGLLRVLGQLRGPWVGQVFVRFEPQPLRPLLDGQRYGAVADPRREKPNPGTASERQPATRAAISDISYNS